MSCGPYISKYFVLAHYTYRHTYIHMILCMYIVYIQVRTLILHVLCVLYSSLTSCCHAMAALLYPLSWQVSHKTITYTLSPQH